MSITQINGTLDQINNNTSLTNSAQNKKNVGTNNLDSNAFLQLLMAQLKYQDPTDPTDTKDLLTQQAQLTQVDSLNQLNSTTKSTSQLSAASNLTGKKVEVKDTTGALVQGLVESAQIGATGVSLTIAGKSYEASKVTQIFTN